MTKYELTYLTVHEEPSDGATVRDVLVHHGATIESVNAWTGRRKLAYPIKKEDQAFFTTVVFEVEPNAIKPITDALKAKADVLRSLIVRYIPQPAPSKDEAAPKAEAQPVKPETETPPKPAATPKTAKPKRASRKSTAEESAALDEKIEELLREDIAK